MFGGGAGARPALALDVERPVRITRHDWRRAEVDLPAYVASGLPAETMGRSLAEDPLFFGAALAGGAALAELAGSETGPVESGVGGRHGRLGRRGRARPSGRRPGRRWAGRRSGPARAASEAA